MNLPLRKTTLLAALLASLSLPTLAHARLGETPDQLTARFGNFTKVKMKTTDTSADVQDVRSFACGEYVIVTRFVQWKSVSETISRPNGELTPSVIARLLESYGQGYTWERPTAGATTYTIYRSDGQAAARYNGTCLRLFAITPEERQAAQEEEQRSMVGLERF